MCTFNCTVCNNGFSVCKDPAKNYGCGWILSGTDSFMCKNISSVKIEKRGNLIIEKANCLHKREMAATSPIRLAEEMELLISSPLQHFLAVKRFIFKITSCNFTGTVTLDSPIPP